MTDGRRARSQVMRWLVLPEPSLMLVEVAFDLAIVFAVGQISRLESCPMMWAASGFSVAMPSRTA
ncbi:hypothetical protein MSP7336_02119 [Mycobacterium shimoidei]|uniref:Uncharacterized protein n=1 Tax=Mycobacterium shimoidei TaxID=29313 RepID=A0A375YYS3_MYCSH|nr:hypothetical protein MSP7336_02119 [Mycobacterium shimoidei]